MFLRSFPLLRRVVTLGLLLGTPVTLSSCGNCAAAGLCRSGPIEIQPRAVVSSLTVVAPGQTITVPVEVDLQGISEAEPLEFGTGDAAARATGGRRVLAVFDGGRVVIRWSGWVPGANPLGALSIVASPVEHLPSQK